jgi:hypothetical protein
MNPKAILSVLIIFAVAMIGFADEGMWPLSELDKLDLGKAGFEIGAREIFNPDGSVSLIDAIINLSGCSASFISGNGLILTNHHCAFGAVQEASTKENDYLRDGLVTRNLGEEIQAKGMTVKITESYRDVSTEVLRVVKKRMSPLERTKAIEKRIKEMEITAEKANPGKRAEIAEMFQGKVYVLFLSTYLKDIRLVYVPPRYVGEFGGESDNWVWPRHTGDFTLMRAYIGKDGKSTAYAADNVPFKPRRFLKVAPEGVSEGDLMFILGYPGRTYRHQPASYLKYEEEIRMPAVAALSSWLISAMEKAGEDEREIQLKLAARIKGLANRMKNFQGKLKGLRNLGLTAKKRQEENALLAGITDPVRRKTFEGLLGDMNRVYEEMGQSFAEHHFVANLGSNWNVLGIASTLVGYAHERTRKDQDRESPYMSRNLDRTRQYLVRSAKNIHVPLDRQVAAYMLSELGKGLAGVKWPPRLNGLLHADSKSRLEMIDTFYDADLLDADKVGKLFDTVQLEDLKKNPSPVIQLALELYPVTRAINDLQDKWKGRLDAAMASWVDIKQMIQKEGFFPDANSTLRLTWGRIKGYSPRNAVTMMPFTTLDGMIEKSHEGGDYMLGQSFKDLIAKAGDSAYNNKKIGGVPVNILYDADTTGGNSGSPVLNHRGELVGLNFDRAFEATINDFAWDAGYSRSIGVDIRFILWYIEATGGAHLLQEMRAEGAK